MVTPSSFSTADALTIVFEEAQKLLLAWGQAANVFRVCLTKLALDGDLEFFVDRVLPTRNYLLNVQAESRLSDGWPAGQARRFIEGKLDCVAASCQFASKVLFACESLDGARQNASEEFQSLLSQAPKSLGGELATTFTKLIETLNASLSQKFEEQGRKIGAQLIVEHLEMTQRAAEFDEALSAQLRLYDKPEFAAALRVIEVATASELQPIRLPVHPIIKEIPLMSITATEAVFAMACLLVAFSKPPARKEDGTFPDWTVEHI